MATKTKMSTSSTRASNGSKGDPNKNYVPLSKQSGVTGITNMTPSDKGGFEVPGYDIDYSRSKKGQQGGRTIYQPYYVKKKSTTSTSSTTAPAQAPAPKPAQKPASTPKERTASRTQTVIDANGKKTVKTVVYSKYNQSTRKWEDQDAPLVIDYRTKEKKYQGGKTVKF
jgi:hypothetical protein